MDTPPPYPEIPRVVESGRPSRLFLWVGIVAGVLVVAVVVGTFFGIRYLATEYTPAADPFDLGACSDCFDNDDALSLAPGEEALAALGGAKVMSGYEPGFVDTVRAIYSTATDEYARGEGTPYGCSFALAGGPITSSNAATTSEGDENVIALGSYGDDFSSVTQSVRVFDDDWRADDYPAELREALAHCTHYEVDLGDDGPWATDVEQVKFEVADQAVDAVAWREESDGYEYTVVDLQYRNLAIRSIFSTVSGGHIDDEEFAAFIVETSRALYELAPIEPVEAAACEGTCFTIDETKSLVPDAAALESLGAATIGYVPMEPNTIGLYADDAHERYHAGGGDPIGCDFAVSIAPLTPMNPEYSSRDDLVVDLGLFGDGASVSQLAQVFESTLYADRAITSLRSGVERCAHIEVELDGTAYVSDLSPLELPTSSPEVTMAGWTEVSADIRYTVVDLHYANLVVRSVFAESATGEEFTDEQITAFVLATSERLESLGDR